MKPKPGDSAAKIAVEEGDLIFQAGWRMSVLLPPFLEKPQITVVPDGWSPPEDLAIEEVTTDKFTVAIRSSAQRGKWKWRARGPQLVRNAESQAGPSHLSTNDKPTVQEVILLIHGIRDFAEWEHKVSPILKEIAEKEVWPLSYGRFDAVRFWFPIWTRDGPVKKLLWRIRSARRDRSATAKLSVLAHSFGTYAIGRILKENPDIRLYRLVLCGAVLPTDFRWDQIQNSVETDIINDCGIRDIWPVLAQSTTFGYGPSGRFGFGTPGVRDRFHDFGHGGFFQEEFVRGFWLPWFREQKFVESKAPQPSGARWHLLTIIQIKWLVPILSTVAILFYLLVLLFGRPDEGAPSLAQPGCPWEMIDLSHGQLPKNLAIITEALVHDGLDPAIKDDLKKWRSPAARPTNARVAYEALFGLNRTPVSVSVRKNVKAKLFAYVLDESGSYWTQPESSDLTDSVEIRFDRQRVSGSVRIVAIVFPFDEDTFDFLHEKESQPCEVLQTGYQ